MVKAAHGTSLFRYVLAERAALVLTWGYLHHVILIRSYFLLWGVSGAGTLFCFGMRKSYLEEGMDMNQVIKDLLARREKLEAVIKKAEADLKKVPEGKLWVSANHRSAQYYQIRESTDSSEIEKKYLSRKEEHLKSQLVYKEYLKILIASSKDEMEEIDEILSRGKLFQANTVYEDMHPCKRALLKPLLMNDDDFVKWWENEPFDPYDKWPEDLKYPTKHGEMVRTKSEAIIADAYYELGIPYRYECPVKLYGGEVRHPDFTLLDAGKRKVIYHEHLGMLDDSGYRKDTMQKLDLYRRSGIFVGKNLILTHEASGSPFNIRVFKQNLLEMFELEKGR